MKGTSKTDLNRSKEEGAIKMKQMISKLMTQKRVMDFKILSNSLNSNRIKTTNSRINNNPKMIRMMQALI